MESMRGMIDDGAAASDFIGMRAACNALRRDRA